MSLSTLQSLLLENKSKKAIFKILYKHGKDLVVQLIGFNVEIFSHFAAGANWSPQSNALIIIHNKKRYLVTERYLIDEDNSDNFDFSNLSPEIIAAVQPWAIARKVLSILDLSSFKKNEVFDLIASKSYLDMFEFSVVKSFIKNGWTSDDDMYKLVELKDSFVRPVLELLGTPVLLERLIPLVYYPKFNTAPFFTMLKDKGLLDLYVRKQAASLGAAHLSALKEYTPGLLTKETAFAVVKYNPNDGVAMLISLGYTPTDAELEEYLKHNHKVTIPNPSPKIKARMELYKSAADKVARGTK